MEAIKQIIRTPKNREVRIKIPSSVPENELVEVILIVRNKPENFAKKVKELKAAVNDERFLNDLKEVTDEFEVIDIVDWEGK